MTQPQKTLEPMSNTKTPNYIGPGEHSVRELEKMCSQFQQIISEMNASQFVKKDEQPDGYLLNGVFKTVDQFRGMTISAGDNVQSVYFNPVKKDSVSSDVEQAAKDYYETVKDETGGEIRHVTDDFKAGAKWQSTQQPATINWLTDEEIEQISMLEFPINLQPNGRTLSGGKYDVDINYCNRSGFVKGFTMAQSELRKRVNCVDVEQLTKIRNEMYDSMPVGAGLGVLDIVRAVNAHLTKMDNFIDNITSNPNGQK